MRLYIEGHSIRHGYVVSRTWSNAECSAINSPTAEELRPARFFKGQGYAYRFVERWNRRFATHEAGDERMPNEMPEHHSITYYPPGSHQAKRVGHEATGVYCLGHDRTYTYWPTLEIAMGEAWKLGTTPVRWSLDHPENMAAASKATA